MGATAALHTAAILDNLEHILSIELLAACQGIDFRRKQLGAQAHMGCGTAPAYLLIRQLVPFQEHDALLYPYMKAVHHLVVSRQIVAAVDEVVSNSW